MQNPQSPQLSRNYRATDATVYCAVEGSGQSHIGDNSLAWKEHDIFVAPSWFPVSHDAEQDSVIFSFSDRPLQQYLSLWREEELA
jgi:gentisate 1,2-dioxygenase